MAGPIPRNPERICDRCNDEDEFLFLVYVPKVGNRKMCRACALHGVVFLSDEKESS